MAAKLSRSGREAVSATKALLGDGAGIHDHEESFAALWNARNR